MAIASKWCFQFKFQNAQVCALKLNYRTAHSVSWNDKDSPESEVKNRDV